MGLNFFNDIAQRIETSLIEPLRDFRRKVAPLNTIHNESLSNLEQNINALLTGSDGQPAFQGGAAQQLGELVGEFVRNERKLSGTSSDPIGWDLTGRLGDSASKNKYYAELLATQLDSLRAYAKTHGPSSGVQQAAAGATLTAGTLDAGAGLQLGIDIPWDLVAAGATGIALGLDLAVVAINADAPEALAAFSFVLQTVPQIKQDYQTIEHNDPLPPEMQSPKGPRNDYTPFLKLLGIIGGGTILALGITELIKGLPVDPNKRVSEMTPQELDDLKKYLSEELGCSPTQIQKILEQIKEKNPTAAQVAQLLQGLKIKAQLEALKQQVENSSLPGKDSFLKDQINGDLNRIDSDIKNGDWITWDPRQVQSWQTNVNTSAYQWQAAQTLNARGIGGSGQQQPDVTGGDNVWYEVKDVPNITQGDNTFNKMVQQLKGYADTQPDNARGIGVVVPPGADHNLGTELLLALKSKYPNDPNIKRLSNVSVKFIDPNLPDLPSNRWCRLPNT